MNNQSILQTASLPKRIAAFLIDFILLEILVVGIAFVASKITSYDKWSNELDSYYTYYEETYGVSFELTQEEQAALAGEELEKYQMVEELISKDEKMIKAYNVVLNLTMIIAVISVLISVIILEFLVPLIFFKNGRTIGKKIFGLAVVSNNGVKAKNLQLFVRAVLGKFTIELMIPIFLIILLLFQILGIESVIGLFILIIIQVFIFFSDRQRPFFHDKLSLTCVIPMDTQRIFENNEELIKYKEERAREKALQKTDY